MADPNTKWIEGVEDEYGLPFEQILRDAVEMAPQIHQTQREFADELGVHAGTIYRYLRRYGLRWPTKGVRVPPEEGDSPWASIYVTYRGVRKPLRRWADELGIPYPTVYGRIRRGWDPVDAITKPQETPQERGERGKKNLKPGWKGYRRG